MKTDSLKCTNCGAQLQVDMDEGQGFIACSSCGYLHRIEVEKKIRFIDEENPLEYLQYHSGFDDPRVVELRKRFESLEFKKILVENKSEKCANCGSEKNVQFHHVVPLYLGGTNNLGNIVPLCFRCHKSAHYGQHMRNYQNKDVSGRPHTAEDDKLIEAFDLYSAGKIGTAECKRMINLSGKSHISDMRVFREYKKERGIKQIRNNVDIILKKRGTIAEGAVVGRVLYDNGTVVELKWGEET